MADTFTSSPFVKAIEPITESDEELERILAEAELAPLLPALAYATGDLSILHEHLKTNPLLAQMPQYGLTEEQQAEIRAIALEKLRAFRDGGCEPAPVPSDDDVLRIMEYAVSGEGMRDYLPLIEEEMAHLGEDRRGPRFRKDELAADRDFRVAIIGAGMSGILAAHRLQQAGVEFTIFEKNDDVGGTWYENQYPGCRVDNPNHNYSYSFAQRHDWPFHYSPQPVLHRYFKECADAFDVRRHVRFETEVVSADWDEEEGVWRVLVRDRKTGAEETVVANAIVSAVGQLNRPNLPDIAGIETFTGPAFHSARWDHSVELAGKRVVVIGTGASAVQFIPEVAEEAAQVTVFQRTPPWLAPSPKYHQEVPSAMRWMYEHVPSYSEWNRFLIFWRMGDGALATVRVDPAWDGGEQSVSAMNDMARQLLTGYLQMEFADRPDLLEHAIPDYPVGAKRMILDDGIWARTLKRDNVRLVTDGIREITPEGVVDRNGELHEADVVIYGTGFQASKFLTPMKVTGRSGIDLHEMWGGDARAYLGVTIPNFPNLFLLYGPNTNIVINGSIVYFSELGVRYILGLIQLMLERDLAAIDVRKDVHDEFNERCDAENRRMAWGVSKVNSWYKNDHGHVAQNWPFTLLEYWQRTLEPNPDDYELIGR
ncbi:MAG TPA: NAD(P)/FAD-dependent oxidoreductase [Acidimicrobiales bacterium]|jgi:4-hydroxyacetophenone monooxygenase|nr:NAD(P)/FAD-dependent oxidoreductase [Acidimicrobiales bacterium]